MVSLTWKLLKYPKDLRWDEKKKKRKNKTWNFFGQLKTVAHVVPLTVTAFNWT